MTVCLRRIGQEYGRHRCPEKEWASLDPNLHPVFAIEE
jgi:hypothetical protein